MRYRTEAELLKDFPTARYAGSEMIRLYKLPPNKSGPYGANAEYGMEPMAWHRSRDAAKVHVSVGGSNHTHVFQADTVKLIDVERRRYDMGAGLTEVILVEQ